MVKITTLIFLQISQDTHSFISLADFVLCVAMPRELTYDHESKQIGFIKYLNNISTTNFYFRQDIYWGCSVEDHRFGFIFINTILLMIAWCLRFFLPH